MLLRLLLEPNQSVSIDRLADFVWGAELPKTLANSIARFVADLRRVLESAAGEAHDWIPAVAGFLGMWSFVHPVPVHRRGRVSR